MGPVTLPIIFSQLIYCVALPHPVYAPFHTSAISNGLPESEAVWITGESLAPPLGAVKAGVVPA